MQDGIKGITCVTYNVKWVEYTSHISVLETTTI